MFIDTHHMRDASVTDPPRARRAASSSAVRTDRAPRPLRGVIAMPEDAALVLVDFRQAFERGARGEWSVSTGARNGREVVATAARLLAEWRATGRPVVHVEHAPRFAMSQQRTDASGARIDPVLQPLPEEPVYRKRHGSAFVETTLARDLMQRRVRTIVLTGFTTDQAVSSTARSASDLGFTTIVVSDATAAFDREAPDGTRFPAVMIHQTALASLHAEIAIVLPSELVLEGVARAAIA